MTMRMYISGGMHGLPKEQQEKFFRNEAERVELRGWQAFVPHDIPPDHRSHDFDENCPRGYSPGAACYMRGDLIVLLECDAVLMIGKWHESVGASREHDVAIWTGIPIYYRTEDVPYLHSGDR
jgi:hypothetical protein